MYRKFILGIIVLICTTSAIFSQDNSKGNFSSKVYFDYYYNIARDQNLNLLNNTVVDGPKDMQGFEIRRIYFTYDHIISDDFTSRFRLEMDSKSLTDNGKIAAFVKDAYIKWNNIFTGSDLIVGLQPTPAFQISESYWGYRSLEKTILDLRGYVSSRDIAISLKGRINHDATVNYWVMFGNSSSNKPESNKYKRFYAHLNFVPLKNMDITVYGDLKVQPDIQDPNSTNPDDKISNNSITSAVFVGYQQKNNFSVGAEGFINITQNAIMMPVANGIEVNNANGMGISLFGNYAINSMLGLMGRFDYFDPLTGSDYKGNSRNFFIAGFDVKPIDNFSIIPNVMIETYEELQNGTSIGPSVTGRVTFYYHFK